VQRPPAFDLRFRESPAGFAQTYGPPRGPECDRIAGYDVVASSSEPGTDEHTAATETADELTLVDGRDRCCAYRPLEAVRVDLDAPLPVRSGTFAGLHSPLDHAQIAGLQRHQTVLALELATHFLRPLEVVGRGRFGAILAHERHGDVHVIVVVLRQPVTHGDPPAGGQVSGFQWVAEMIGIYDMGLAFASGDSSEIASEVVEFAVSSLASFACAAGIAASTFAAGPVGTAAAAGGCYIVGELVGLLTIGVY
jgi:hypothetical protein